MKQRRTDKKAIGRPFDPANDIALFAFFTMLETSEPRNLSGRQNGWDGFVASLLTIRLVSDE
jgi:hypothetical protein